MTHETASSEQKAVSDGCCGGMAKGKAAAPAVAKPAADPKHADHKKASGSCCQPDFDAIAGLQMRKLN